MSNGVWRHGCRQRLAPGLIVLVAWLATANGLARPAQAPKPGPARAADVAFVNGHNWRLVSASSSPANGPLALPQDADQQPVMRFDPQASAAAGYLFMTKLCNGAGIAYRLTADRRIHEVQNSNMTFTAMACGDDLTELERRVQLQLRHIHSFEPLPRANRLRPSWPCIFRTGRDGCWQAHPPWRRATARRLT